MALISDGSGRARRDAPPPLIGGEATIERDEAGADWIVLAKEKAEPLVVEPGSDLVFALEAVRSVGDARAFVRSYGLLRRGPESFESAGPLRESFADWQFEIARIRAIATYVRLTYLGLQALRDGVSDPEPIRTLRDWMGFNPADGTPISPAEGLDDLDVLRATSYRVQEGINERLGESRWAIAVDVDSDDQIVEPNVFSFVAHPATPGALAYAYWQLADLIVARAPLAQCEGCGRFFDRHDKRQRFHDDACRQRFAYERRERDKRAERLGEGGTR